MNISERSLHNAKKKPTLDYNQMSPFHAGLIKKKKNPNFKGKTSQTYSSFIIKMLDETPINFNKSIKKISLSAYKNLFKKKDKEKFNPFNTEYSPKKVNNLSSFEKNLKKIEKNLIKKNNYLKEYKTKYDFNRKNSTLSIDSPEKNKDNIKILEKKLFQNLNNNTTSFLNKIANHKKGKIIPSLNNLNKMRLNSLYGYDKKFMTTKNHLSKIKEDINLGKYQNEVLKLSQRNLSKDYMMKLFTDLQSIKKDADLVKPLPPINYKALVNHCFKNESEKKKITYETQNKDKPYKNMDEYEKELYKIKKSSTFKKEKMKRNKRMYKIYEILPEYVIDALFKKKNRQINL